MSTRSATLRLAGVTLASLPVILWAALSLAQEQLPWQRGNESRYPRDEGYSGNGEVQRYGDPRPGDVSRAPPYQSNRPYDTYQGAPPSRPNDAYSPRYGATQPPTGGGNPPVNDAYQPPRPGQNYDPPRGGDYAQGPGGYGQGAYPPARPAYGEPYGPPPGQGYNRPSSGYGQPYTPPGQAYDDPAERGYGPPDERRYGSGPYGEEPANDTYSSREILGTGHQFFGSVSKGLASVIEYAFQKQGRPNGYILGQDAGGALIAGLRYGEGTLYTKDAGVHRVYWQGPSIGYDAGVEGSKVMMLVYNLSDPQEIYQRFGGVDGSAYIVGGVGLTFQTGGNIVIAPIRSGVGLRLGANVGYLKYTRRPTWNPF